MKESSPAAPESGERVVTLGLRERLHRSHAAVAALGVGMLVVALVSTLGLRSVALGLARERGPTVKAAGRAMTGLQASLAAVRGSIVLGDPAFVEERAAAWSDEIEPALATLLGLESSEKGESGRRLEETALILEDLKEWQWWIEDVARTPGNEPARVELDLRVAPTSRRLRSGVERLIALERREPAERGRKELFAFMSGLQRDSDRFDALLSSFADEARPEDEALLRAVDRRASAALEAIASHDRLSAEQAETCAWLTTELRGRSELAWRVVELRKEPGWNAARHWLGTEALPRTRRAGTRLSAIAAEQDQRMRSEATLVSWIGNGAALLLLGLIAAMVLVARRLSERAADRIVEPIGALAQATRELANGDVSRDLPVTGNDELGQLTEAFNTMRGSLRLAERAEELGLRNRQVEDALRRIRETVDRLHASSAELAAVTSQQSRGLSSQAAAVTETGTTAEELFRAALENLELANAVAESSRRSEEVGRAGRQAVDESMSAMIRVKAQVESIGGELERLLEKARSIGTIADLVDEFAAQTKVLALNASIEAARVGRQHGQAFTVVAREVDGLSTQSRDATAEVRALVTRIVDATSSVAESSERVASEAANATDVASRADETIRTLEDLVGETALAGARIADSSAQQRLGIEHVTGAMRSIREVVQRNEEGLARLEDTTKDLGDIASHLAGLLEADEPAAKPAPGQRRG